MKRAVFLLAVLATVAVVLAGGTSFMLQRKKLLEFQRQANTAEEKFRNGSYEEALQLLRRVDLAGGSARSSYLLGKTYYELGRKNDALPYFDRIEQRYPRSGYLPEALLFRGRYTAEEIDDAERAKEVFLRICEEYPQSQSADHALYELGRLAFREGNVDLARRTLAALMRRPDSPAKEEAEFILGDINMRALKSPEPGPEKEVYTIKRGDSIWALERKFKVPGDLITGLNDLNPQALTIGTQILIPRLDISIVVDKEKRVLIVRNQNSFFKKYRVGINKVDGVVKTGDYKLDAKFAKGLDWVDTARNTSIKAGEPGNPYGPRYLQLRRELGIHGCADPAVIGRYIDAGNIAMENRDIEELYGLVRVGTPVAIRGKVQQ